MSYNPTECEKNVFRMMMAGDAGGIFGAIEDVVYSKKISNLNLKDVESKLFKIIQDSKATKDTPERFIQETCDYIMREPVLSDMVFGVRDSQGCKRVVCDIAKKHVEYVEGVIKSYDYWHKKWDSANKLLDSRKMDDPYETKFEEL